jgi:putative transposase
VFADSADDRTMLMDNAAMLDFIVEVVRKMKDQRTLVPLKRRWMVEQSFGRIMNWRRLWYAIMNGVLTSPNK